MDELLEALLIGGLVILGVRALLGSSQPGIECPGGPAKFYGVPAYYPGPCGGYWDGSKMHPLNS